MIRLAALLLPFLAGVSAAQSPATQVTFELNDAFVKGKALEGVEVSLQRSPEGPVEHSGFTGAGGRLVIIVEPGKWLVSYRLRGYVPVVRSETDFVRGAAIVTTSLSMNLESEGSDGGRRVRMILNWGSGADQVRDLDAHALCVCVPANPHIYYQARMHEAGAHEVSLDVDDRDGGGPETITLRDPTPGQYRYFVHNFSGAPARLGASDAVVRVLSGDELIGEFRVPPDVAERVWRPFKAIEVTPEGKVWIVPFAESELKRAEDRRAPVGTSTFREPADEEGAPVRAAAPAKKDNSSSFGVPIAVLVVVLIILAELFLRRRRAS
ncbi:MAG: hypothetical protein AAB074_15580 [Planctomycetota bacterium]